MPIRLILPLLAFLILYPALFSAMAQDNDVPRLISYQGQLILDDQPVTGTHDFSFALYDQAEGGNELWSENHPSQTVQNGVFSVYLGNSNALSDEVFEAEDLYLSVSHQGTEIDRLRLTSTPFSVRAARADRSRLAEDVEDGVVTASKLADDAAVLSLNDLTGGVTIEGEDAASVSVDGNTITISVDENGGLQLVATDGTLTGTGLPGDELGLAGDAAVLSLNDLVGDVSLEGEGAASVSVDGSTITIDVDDAGGGISSVNTDGETIGGDGVGEPITLLEGAVDEDRLADGVAVRSLNGLTDAVDLVEGDNITINPIPGQDAIEISADAGNGPTSVNTDATIEGDGSSGAPLGISDNHVVRSLDGETGHVEFDAGENIQISSSNGTITISAELPDNGTGAGVSSLNDLTGDLTLEDDAPISVDPNDDTITISMDSGAITAEHLQDGAVTADKLASGAAVSTLLTGGATLQDDVTVIAGTGIDIEADENNGSMTVMSNGNQTSSIRFKDHVIPIEEPVALVQQLQGVRYEWVDDGSADVGLIAEEVHEVLPEVVSFEDDGATIQGLNYGKLVSVLVEATKEQQETIEEQQRTIDEMEERLKRLERLVEQETSGNTSNDGTER